MHFWPKRSGRCLHVDPKKMYSNFTILLIYLLVLFIFKKSNMIKTTQLICVNNFCKTWICTKKKKKAFGYLYYKLVALGYCPCEPFIKASQNHQSPFLLTIFNTVPLVSFSPFVCIREHFGPPQTFTKETVNTSELVTPVQSNFITSHIYFNIFQTICMNKTSCPPIFTSSHS